MRIFLSSVILFFGTVHVAFAGPLNSCPGLDISWECVDGVPQLQATRTDRAIDVLSYFLSIGDDETGVEMAAHQRRVSLKTARTVDIVGLGVGGGEGCCVARRSIPIPPENLCAPVDVSEEDTAHTSEQDVTPETPDERTPLDLATSLFVNDPCESGPVGSLCRGSVQVSHVEGEPLPPIVPITVTATPSFGGDLTLSGPANCLPMGAGAGFCQIGGTDLTQVSLSLALSVPPAFETRQTEICVALRPPADDTQTMILVQTAFKALGFDPGPLDGVEGEKSKAALAEFSNRYQLEATTMLAPEVLAFLGLGSFVDSNDENNQQCQTVTLKKKPRPQCDPNSTRPKGDACQCKYEGMRAVSATRCACPKGTRYVAGAGCRKTDRPTDAIVQPTVPLRCDPSTTVSTGEACVCRYSGMRKLSRTRCGCAAGQTFYSGEGCL